MALSACPEDLPPKASAEQWRESSFSKESDVDLGGLGFTVVDSASDWRRPGEKVHLGSSRSMPSLGSSPTPGALMSSTCSSWKPIWHTRSTFGEGSPVTSSRPLWSTLGGTWRRRNADEDGAIRTNVDDAAVFVEGCVPAWGRSAQIRKGAALEHELSWAYYQMRRHEKHPQRKQLGERLPLQDVPREMRMSAGSDFQFWRDLRPPFMINSAVRVDEGNNWHPDGELFDVKYECPIDYNSERVCPDAGQAGTFDTKVRGTASVRIPYKFPVERPVRILSWGRPHISHSPNEEAGRKGKVSEEIWNPMASEFHLRADCERLTGIREASKRVTTKVHLRPVQVRPLQRLALGPHASLPRLAEAERSLHQNDPSSSSATPEKQRKTRGHRICTASCGFVTYVG